MTEPSDPLADVVTKMSDKMNDPDHQGPVAPARLFPEPKGDSTVSDGDAWSAWQ